MTTTTTTTARKVRFPNAQVQLVGQDGNAFAIMGRVAAALRAAGATRAEVNEYQTAAMSGDYDNLLRVTLEWVNDGSDEEDEEDEEADDFYGCEDEDEDA